MVFFSEINFCWNNKLRNILTQKFCKLRYVPNTTAIYLAQSWWGRYVKVMCVCYGIVLSTNKSTTIHTPLAQIIAHIIVSRHMASIKLVAKPWQVGGKGERKGANWRVLGWKKSALFLVYLLFFHCLENLYHLAKPTVHVAQLLNQTMSNMSNRYVHVLK